MLSLAAFGSVQLVDGLHADAATCRAAWCAPPAGTTTSTAASAPRNRAILRPAIAPTPPAPIRRPVVVPTTMRITTPSAPAPTIPPDPTTCAGVVAGIAWPPGWRVQCGEDVYEDLHGMHHALWTAWNLARDVHRTTGLPTAVTVRMGCGDGVMMGYNG